MVIYDLVCEHGHGFEGWFKNADDLVAQQRNGLLTCPYCDTSAVNKVLAAPKLTKKSNSQPAKDAQGPQSSTKLARNQTELVAGRGQQNITTNDKAAFAKLQKMLGKVHDYIDTNFTDVGNRFTDEAISMHKGDKEPSNIRGTASKEQLKQLADEGVQALPVPNKPINKNKLN